jgi:NitT/TauT family transport system substrate-binding protein
MLRKRSHLIGAVAAGIVTFAALPGLANDLVRVGSSSRGLWDTTLIEFGQRKGIYKDAGIDLEIIWTEGGADAQQAVITGSIDVAVATGMLGVVAAWAKGAPVAILAADFLGGTDMFWYVKKDSPIKSVKDLGGRTVGYSRPGSSSHLMAQAVVEWAGVNAKLVPSGNPAASFTSVMTGQIDVGWSSPPIQFDQIKGGNIRILFNGSDSPEIAAQTVRVTMANANFLASKPDVVKRFLKGVRKTIEWAYGTDEALQMLADLNKVPIETARQARDQGFPLSNMEMKPIRGIELTLKQALETKRISRPLTEAQVNDMLKHVSELNVD